MDFEAIHRWLLLQPFIIVRMAAIFMAAAYLIDRLMEWLTGDRRGSVHNADGACPIPDSFQVSHGAGWLTCASASNVNAGLPNICVRRDPAARADGSGRTWTAVAHHRLPGLP